VALDLLNGRQSQNGMFGLCQNEQNRGPAWNTYRLLSAQIRKLIASLSRSVDLLNLDIDTEEERTWLNNVFDPAYPMLARHLRARRDNLNMTIAALRERLPKERTPEANYSESLAG
jgi:hypothetical protein